MDDIFDDTTDPFSTVPRTTKIKTLGLTHKQAKSMTNKSINIQYFLKSQLYEFLKELSPIQMKIVFHKNGSIMCSAVPGAGKTRTLVYKVAYLIEHCNVDPNRILVITFTKKASNEIRDRIENILLKKQDNRVIVGTFHSVCYRFLKSLGLVKNVTHVDDQKQNIILEEIVSEMSKTNVSDINDNKFIKSVIKNSLNEIAKAKNKMENPVDLKKNGNELTCNIYEKYQEYLETHNYIDFDDLLVKLIQEARNNETSLEHLENRFDYVFVDEFQDTNTLQFEIISYFAGKTQNITIVGDSDQSIYGWRFADSSNITKFKETFPNHVVYLLDQNYRSTWHIINCANSIIQQEKGRINNKITTENELGNKVELHEFVDPDAEAKYICNKISHLTNPNKTQRIGLSNIAILLRTNQQSRIYEEILTKLKIPFQLLGTYDFYKSDEVQFVLAYLKFIVNNKDILSFRKILTVHGNIGDNVCNEIESNGWNKFISNPYDERLDNLVNIIEECIIMNKNKIELSQIIKYITTSTNLFDELKGEYGTDEATERWENIGELINLSEKYETIETFLIDMVTTENGTQLTGQKVFILTVHSSKGLEWDVVFIPSVVESVIPHFRSTDVQNINSTKEIAEERRLLYVAMTRARQRLFLSYCRIIKVFGKKNVVKISRFLKDLPKESFTLTKN